MISSMDTTTWHDQRPTHRKMTTARFDALALEDASWYMVDEATEEFLMTGEHDPDMEAWLLNQAKAASRIALEVA